MLVSPHSARKLRLTGFPRLLGLFLVTAMFGPVAPAQPAAQVGLSNQEVTELIVLYDDKISPDRATSDEVVDAVKNPERNARNVFLSRVLDSPNDARHVIAHRHNYDVSQIARNAENPDEDPAEVRMQKYVVLSYASAGATRAAFAKLEKDPNVVWVGLNARVFPSAIPLDPLVSSAASLYDYQWGLRPRANQLGGTAGVNGINVFSAWDNVRGHAYVAHLDTGVETHSSVPAFGMMNSNSFYVPHVDLSFNFRPQFAYNSALSATNAPVPFDDEVGGFRGHGTHTAGVIAANTSNASAQFGHPALPPAGGAGVCWYCSLLVAKIVGPNNGSFDSFASGLDWAVKSGTQIVNLSLGIDLANAPPNYCANNPASVICVALTLAANRDVVISAAAGNQGYASDLQFPAADGRTIAVGASTIDGNRWVETMAPQAGFIGSNMSSAMTTRGVMAPGVDILSTFYAGFDYFPAIRCADSAPGSAALGYGVCTGTSMAAPHVSGVLGLMRSINPQLTAADISARLRNTASNAAINGGTPNNEIGSGIVDAGAATLNVLSDAGFNRLTPLYAFRLNYANNTYAHFYSTVPQMGSAAVLGTLLPLNSNIGFTPVGTVLPPLPSGSNFPGTTVVRKAEVWIFTTHKNPHSASLELVPLYRLSYKCGDTSSQPLPLICGANSQYVSRTYATDIGNVNGFWKDRGYRLDGIEGYVYPIAAAQPPATEALILGENTSNGTYALYPNSQAGAMSSLGFTTQSNLGWAFVNAGSRPNIQYTVTATAGPNGSIAPSSQFVAAGSNASVTVTPTAGYVPVFYSYPCFGTPNSLTYTTLPIAQDCAIDASFITTPSAPTVGAIVPGDTVAFVNFSPAGNGGASITGYTLTCNPGAIASAGITSPIRITGLANGTTYTCGLAAANSVGTGPSSTLFITPSAASALALGAVRSRKTHAAAGPFDLTLDSTVPVAGAVTVEPRKIGAGHTIVFQFNIAITAAGTVSASRGTTTWAATSVAPGTDVIVTLPSVGDNNRVTVTLTNVNGAGGTYTSSMGFLVGDVNNSRSVNSSDISSVKASSGQTTVSSNFLRDLDSSGAINSSDISIVKAQSGLTLVP